METVQHPRQWESVSTALTRETNSAKKKLQASICFRREVMGLDRIDLSEEEMKITKPEYTCENEVQQEIRREQNKLSARRCRKRKRENDDQLKKERIELICGNEDFLKTIRELNEEKQRLESMLLNHNCKMSAERTANLQTEFRDLDFNVDKMWNHREVRDCGFEENTSQFTDCDFIGQMPTELKDHDFIDKTLTELKDCQPKQLSTEFRDCKCIDEPSIELGDCTIDEKASTQFRDCDVMDITLSESTDCKFEEKTSVQFRNCDFEEETATQFRDCKITGKTFTNSTNCFFEEKTSTKFKDCGDFVLNETLTEFREKKSTEYINCNFSDEMLSLLDTTCVNLSYFK